MYYMNYKYTISPFTKKLGILPAKITSGQKLKKFFDGCFNVCGGQHRR